MGIAFHIVEHRISPAPQEIAGMDTLSLRRTFLVENLFAPGELRLVGSGLDRMILGSSMPIEPMRLPACDDFGTSYFTKRRELGVVNLGESGHVAVGGNRYSLDTMDSLYIGAGNEDVSFEPCGSSQPCFYFLSCPAHRELPVVAVRRQDADVELVGTTANASRRRIYKCIHPDRVASCQLVMGFTELEAGSVWNTVPPHTHARRSEIYLYTGLGDGIAVHLMGEPHQTRSLIVHDRQAVLSPAWSIHMAAGTQPYTFVWGMAGENQTFSDIDPVDLHQLR